MRWFRSKNNLIAKAKIIDEILLKNQKHPIYFLLIEIDFISQQPERYFMFLSSIEKEEYFDGKAICKIINKKEQEYYLIDALYSPEVSKQLFNFFHSNKTIRGKNGFIEIHANKLSKQILSKKADVVIQLLNKEQSNTSILFGDTALLKMYRRSELGINPEVEINKFLYEEKKMISPRLAVTINYIHKQHIISAGIIQEYIANKGDGWNYSLEIMANIAKNFENSILLQNLKQLKFPWKRINDSLPQEINQTLGLYAHVVTTIAKKTAQMHLALVGNNGNKPFEAENFTLFDQRSLYQSLRNVIVKTSKHLEKKALKMEDSLQKKMEALFNNKNQIITQLEYVLTHKLGGKKIRCHGDFHLGQTLYTGEDFVIIDYEGEPCRPLSERKIKYPPLKDIAGMLRSFHYAIYTVLDQNSFISPYFQPEKWYALICNIFIHTYRNFPGINSLLPPDKISFSFLLYAYMLEKVFYEINYELNNRPDWVHVPCLGLLNLMDDAYA